MADQDIMIAGYAETPIIHKSGRSAYDLAGEILADLLGRYGIPKARIDGLAITLPISEGGNPFMPNYMADALAITPTWLHAGALGGCSATSAVARAASAIRDGACDIVVVISADAPSTHWGSHYGAFRSEFQDPPGVQGPPAAFGLLMSRYDHQFGLKPEALGKIAITQRDHALQNANTVAKLKKPLAMEDYLSSRMIADPLRVLDCVMFCDGANGVLVMSEATAKAHGLQQRARISAYAEISNYLGHEACPDITQTGFSAIAPKVFAKSGLSAKTIRMFQPYDDFTIAVLMQMEAFGFCATGAGSDYVLGTDLSHTGALPLNTGGGQISAGQPGLASGGLNLVEAVRQLFHEGAGRQVPNPANALVTGIGMIPYGRNWGTSCAMILEA